jgi:peptide/nickel transport system substrate-binding protein
VSGGSKGTTVLSANDRYYLGKPNIDRVAVTLYPTVRAAWAEMLRDHLDMVYEVGIDALDSLEAATTVNIYQYPRHYQYLILLNTAGDTLRSRQVRQALNEAIDREALVRDALGGRGSVSNGPLWPRHWAAPKNQQVFTYKPLDAAAVFSKLRKTKSAPSFRFTCLVTAGNERLALVVKRQLEAVGAEMAIEEASIAEINEARRTHKFDALMVEALSGPSVFRPYMWWHSRGLFNQGMYSSAPVDTALESIQHSANDDEYRAGVAQFQDAILDDPPAIFLAWSERARAVSSRFIVATPEPGGDILSVLRLWRPTAGPSGDSPPNSN